MLPRLAAVLVSLVLAAPSFAADKKLERLWKSKCASCHGQDGKGQTEKGKKMKVRDLSSADYKGTDAEIRKVILEGMKKDEGGVKQEMDAYKDELKPEDVDALVAHVKSYKP